MSYFDDASLVFIPSGTKTSKAYSVKPIDGTGDLTFSRSNDTATRVNSAGLIEKVRTNLLTYSNDFSNAAWTKTNVTLTTGQTDPNGGSTATTVDATNGASAFVRQNISITSGIKYAWSVYIKGSTTGQSIALYTDGASNIYEIKALTTSWQRFTGVATAASSGSSGFYILCGSGYSGLTDLPFDIAFGQVEASDIATDYIATTSAAVSVGPVANVPRLDYLNSSCPRLLLEPQRTNLVTNSENLNGAGWSLQGSTITSNATTSPDGYSNADAIVETATTNEHNRIAITSLTAASHTASVFLKKFNQTWCAVYLFNGTVGIRHWINLDTLTAGTSANIGAGITAPLTLTNYGNGWVRASMTFTPTAGSWSFYIACARSNGGATTYAGDGTSGLYAWGAQVEAGAYATSYIPTLGAAVTRGADSCSKTGISSLIGQTEGTLYAEANIRANKDSVRALQASDGTINNRIQLAFIGNDFSPAIVTGGVVQAGITVPFTAGNNKFAIAYANNDVVAYLNGVQVLVDNSATIPTCSVLDVGQSLTANTNTLGDPISQALVFKTRLTNAQLAELTSL